MPLADLGDVQLHYRLSGADTGPAIVFANPLGLELSLWDHVVAALPPHLRILRYDMRGHGGSSAPTPPYSMGALVRDAERLLDLVEIRDCVFVGLALGGMVAQGLAVKRLDLIRALVLSNTAAKIDTPQLWQRRMERIQHGGLAALSDETMERWFPRAARDTGAHKPWQAMFERQPLTGYLGGCAAIAGTDFFTPTSGLRLPTLGLAGSEDRATPPDLVRETVELIPGSQFTLLRRCGHVPPIDQPTEYAARIAHFLQDIGHHG